jgi:hypothetical protein
MFAQAGELVSRPDRGPVAGAGEVGFRAEPATERGSNPVSRSTLLFSHHL